MRLSKLLSTASKSQRTHSEMDPEVRSLEYDSRRLGKDSLFFALRGEVTDGHLYLEEALKKGAVAVTSQQEAPLDFPVPWIQVPAARPFMAALANEFYDHPSRRMELAGITGTNGKTTTAFLIHSILKQHSPALLMGTVKTVIGERELESHLTTPESLDIQRRLAQALLQGCRRGAIEASSHALFLHRVYQCRFPVAVFTNLSQDHLDFHKTLEEYFQAKRLLFQDHYNPGLEYAVLNADDPFSKCLELSPHVRKVTFGFSPSSDVYPITQHLSIRETKLQLNFLGRKLSLESSLAGRHNVYNIMAAAASASMLGVSDDQIQEGVRQLQNVPGRFEKLENEAPFTVIVDYAHTPHALESVLSLCRTLSKGRILCVFGCGGDRDRGKRPLMGALAARLADFTIITSDNPRSEAPEKIIEEVRAGLPSGFTRYETFVDRRKAIARALELAGKGDMVLLAGKGHETRQEMGGRSIHFSDLEVAREML